MSWNRHECKHVSIQPQRVLLTQDTVAQLMYTLNLDLIMLPGKRLLAGWSTNPYIYLHPLPFWRGAKQSKQQPKKYLWVLCCLQRPVSQTMWPWSWHVRTMEPQWCGDTPRWPRPTCWQPREGMDMLRVATPRWTVALCLICTVDSLTVWTSLPVETDAPASPARLPSEQVMRCFGGDLLTF